MARRQPPARNFFLNELHELTSIGKPSGGSLPKLAPINWKAKSSRISKSIKSTVKSIQKSDDPLHDAHLFFVARPESKITKRSDDKKKAPSGEYNEEVNFAKDHAAALPRLGLGLIHVAENGDAVVHATPQSVEQMQRTASLLDRAGPREQARWVALDSFDIVPSELRIDLNWVNSLRSTDAVDSIVELQSILTSDEADIVLRAVAGTMQADLNEEFVGAGTDFSGRRWARAHLTPKRLIELAELFSSIDILHAPHYSLAAAKRKATSKRKTPTKRKATATPITPPTSASSTALSLPCVGVVDAGIPLDHLYLKPYRRGGYLSPDGLGRHLKDHGSRVASRIVFGEQDFSSGTSAIPDGTCRFHDINVAEYDDWLADKAVIPAIEAVVSSAPDVRVFNLSLNSKQPFHTMSDVDQRAALSTLRDLDNLAFTRDIGIVIAAGNSAPGIAPTSPYPDHHSDPDWAMGHWALGFNSIVCGSFIGRQNTQGLAKNKYWPSPICRVGPGIAGAPVPSYSAPGGDVLATYASRPGLGEWCCNAQGTWEDVAGTSFAAPLLARELAFTLAMLQERCEQGAKSFVCTCKAFLAITSVAPPLPERIQPLGARTLGRGRGSSARLSQPLPASAVFLWQGVIPGPDDKVRVLLPVPQDWLEEAEKPLLRIVLAWESPVNDAVSELWACRRVDAQLRLSPDPNAKALRGSKKQHPTYPLLDRTYDLRKTPDGEATEDDTWVLEVSYSEIAPYLSTAVVSPEQRVGLAAELRDDAESPISPQASVQSLPSAAQMTRFTVKTTASPIPIMVKRNV